MFTSKSEVGNYAICFVYVDKGGNGRVSDGGVSSDSTLGRALFADDTNVMMNVTLPVSIPGRIHPVSFFAVGGDAFPLHNNLMKPCPLRNLSSDQRIFNYRLSRARRVVENACLNDKIMQLIVFISTCL